MLYEYLHDRPSGEVHLVRSDDLARGEGTAKTLCGKPLAPMDYAYGDETPNGIAATCPVCRNLLTVFAAQRPTRYEIVLTPLMEAELTNIASMAEAVRDGTLKPGDGENVTLMQIRSKLRAIRDGADRLLAWTDPERSPEPPR